jgi:nucleoside-diphosphate-sugar epimerase
MKKALVCGAGGFIGGHLVARLKSEGYWVRGVDIKENEYRETVADDFLVLDLRSERNVRVAFDGGFDEVYQLAADMGGAGYIFTGEHDADVMHNSAMINLNVAKVASECEDMPVVFYSSSACMYPEHNQMDPNNPNCAEDSAYPADPDSEYGWEKLFSERLYLSYHRNYGLPVRIARFHNIFGPYGSWNNGKEKAPAAICRKVAEASEGGEVEVWGDGLQTRSFLYVDECLEGVRRLVQSDCVDPVNIGSDEMVSINQLVDIACEVGEKTVVKNHVPGPEGVRGRNSDNTFIEKSIGWKPETKLINGIRKTYEWIKTQVEFANA